MNSCWEQWSVALVGNGPWLGWFTSTYGHELETSYFSILYICHFNKDRWKENEMPWFINFRTTYLFVCILAAASVGVRVHTWEVTAGLIFCLAGDKVSCFAFLCSMLAGPAASRDSPASVPIFPSECWDYSMTTTTVSVTWALGFEPSSSHLLGKCFPSRPPSRLRSSREIFTQPNAQSLRLAKLLWLNIHSWAAYKTNLIPGFPGDTGLPVSGSDTNLPFHLDFCNSSLSLFSLPLSLYRSKDRNRYMA